METKEGQTFDFLLASLHTVEDAVKTYDTKSQIVGVGYIFAINVVFTVGALIPGSVELDLIKIVLAWVIVIFPALLFGAVLYPTRRFAPLVGENLSDDEHVYYVRSENTLGVRDYLSRVQDSDLHFELTYEIMKLSGLRDLKRIRFLRALFAAGLSFFALFLSQLLRVGDLFPF
ncbi:MAG: hypothetical protein ACI97A_001965 [Planctomycetota bacterium]|jgi:hypothetical protein